MSIIGQEKSERCCSGDPIAQCERPVCGFDGWMLPACSKHAFAVFATGSKGRNPIADGNGGTIARGWYVRDGRLRGPYTKREAKARVWRLMHGPIVTTVVSPQTVPHKS